jgi:hypothetical protein
MKRAAARNAVWLFFLKWPFFKKKYIQKKRKKADCTGGQFDGFLNPIRANARMEELEGRDAEEKKKGERPLN